MISDQAMTDAAERITVQWTPDGLPWIEAWVNGRTGHFVLDTGAGLLLLNPDLAPGQSAQVVHGLRHTGEALSVPLVGPVEVGIGGHETQIMAGVYDVALALRNNAISGAVGLSCFATQPVTFDLGNAAIWLETPASLAARQHGGTCTQIEVRAPVPHGLEAFLTMYAKDTYPYVAQLDSGANRVFVSKTRQRTAATIKVAPGPAVRAQSFAVTSVPLIHDMVLGLPFFLANRITIDLASGIACITPYEVPAA